MSFENCLARAYTPSSVQLSAPSASGVYGISNQREWIYIGEADNIKACLLDHLKERNTYLSQSNATGFSFELSPPHDRGARRDRLIYDLRPVRNALPEGRGGARSGAPVGQALSPAGHLPPGMRKKV